MLFRLHRPTFHHSALTPDAIGVVLRGGPALPHPVLWGLERVRYAELGTDGGPWGSLEEVADPAPAASTAPAPVHRGRDRPLRDLHAAGLFELAQRTEAAIIDEPLFATADGVLGRPLGGENAVVAGVLEAWARANQASLLLVGPIVRAAESPVLGIRGQTAEQVAGHWDQVNARGGVWLSVDIDWAEAITALPHLASCRPTLSRARLRVRVEQAASKIMGARKLDGRKPLREQGLDSLQAEELRVELEQSLGRKLPKTLVFDHGTLVALVGALEA